MIRASILGNAQGDNGMLRRMFIEISDPARVTALDRAIHSLGQHGFAWNDSYIATAEPGHTVELVMAGSAGAQFMARTATGILIGQVADLPEPRPERGDTFVLEPTAWHNE
jgi:cell filamentation protein